MMNKFQLQYVTRKGLKRSGRSTKTTIQDYQLMKRIVIMSPMSSVKKIQAALVVTGIRKPCDCFKATFEKIGLKSYKARKIPRLSPATKAKRLIFARKFQQGTRAQLINPRKTKKYV